MASAQPEPRGSSFWAPAKGPDPLPPSGPPSPSCTSLWQKTTGDGVASSSVLGKEEAGKWLCRAPPPSLAKGGAPQDERAAWSHWGVGRLHDRPPFDTKLPLGRETQGVPASEAPCPPAALSQSRGGGKGGVAAAEPAGKRAKRRVAQRPRLEAPPAASPWRSAHLRLRISASRLWALSWFSLCRWASWEKVSSEICFRYLPGTEEDEERLRCLGGGGGGWGERPKHLPRQPLESLRGGEGLAHLPGE